MGSAITIIVGNLCIASKEGVIFQRSRVNPVDISTFNLVCSLLLGLSPARVDCLDVFTPLAMDLHLVGLPITIEGVAQRFLPRDGI